MQQNGQQWVPPFQPMTMPEVLRQLHEADWPEVVILHPVDFAACGQHVQGISRNTDTGETFFYFGATKIVCRAPKAETLDLSNRPTRIISPA